MFPDSWFTRKVLIALLMEQLSSRSYWSRSLKSQVNTLTAPSEATAAVAWPSSRPILGLESIRRLFARSRRRSTQLMNESLAHVVNSRPGSALVLYSFTIRRQHASALNKRGERTRVCLCNTLETFCLLSETSRRVPTFAKQAQWKAKNNP